MPFPLFLSVEMYLCCYVIPSGQSHSETWLEAIYVTLLSQGGNETSGKP